MTTRRRLPNRRAAELLDYEVAGLKYTACLGRYNDGHLGEVFLFAGKTGTHLSVAMIEAGVALSFALQHGADLNSMREAFPRNEDGKPEGAIGHLLDLLAKPRAVT